MRHLIPVLILALVSALHAVEVTPVPPPVNMANATGILPVANGGSGIANTYTASWTGWSGNDSVPGLGQTQTFTAVNTYSNNTNAISASTGAVILSAGGLGVAGNIYAAGSLNTTGGAITTGYTRAPFSSSGAVSIYGTTSTGIYGTNGLMIQEGNTSTAGGGFFISISTGTANSTCFEVSAAGDAVIGAQAANATTATGPFLYVPTCAGVPTGTPTGFTGKEPIIIDTSDNRLYFYASGSWEYLSL